MTLPAVVCAEDGLLIAGARVVRLCIALAPDGTSLGLGDRPALRRGQSRSRRTQRRRPNRFSCSHRRLTLATRAPCRRPQQQQQREVPGRLQRPRRGAQDCKDGQ